MVGGPEARGQMSVWDDFKDPPKLPACFLGPPHPVERHWVLCPFLQRTQIESKISLNEPKGQQRTWASGDTGAFLASRKFPTGGASPAAPPAPPLVAQHPSSTPVPGRSHLRRSSGGGTPRRRFTHCWSWLMELLRWAILSGLACGGKLGRRPPPSES